MKSSAGGRTAAKKTASSRTEPTLAEAVAALEARASEPFRRGLSRFGIPSTPALGVPMNEVQAVARGLGRSQKLAEALWKHGVYEARLLACFVADPAALTPASMDRWCRTFDNWAIVDTACFKLFDRTPQAWGRVDAWARRKPEFERRAAFALLASLALHDKKAPDAAFVKGLAIIEAAASDDRNFVRKGVSWALRAIGGRNAALKAKAVALARRLAASDDATARWVGLDALRGLAKKR
jgi:3-methyladenine DNA glycosylase AlkD